MPFLAAIAIAVLVWAVFGSPAPSHTWIAYARLPGIPTEGAGRPQRLIVFLPRRVLSLLLTNLFVFLFFATYRLDMSCRSSYPNDRCKSPTPLFNEGMERSRTIGAIRAIEINTHCLLACVVPEDFY